MTNAFVGAFASIDGLSGVGRREHDFVASGLSHEPLLAPTKLFLAELTDGPRSDRRTTPLRVML